MPDSLTGKLDPRRIPEGSGRVSVTTSADLARWGHGKDDDPRTLRERRPAAAADPALERRQAQARVKFVTRWLHENAPKGPEDIAGQLWAPQLDHLFEVLPAGKPERRSRTSGPALQGE